MPSKVTRKRWEVRNVDTETIRAFVIYAAIHGLTLAEALKRRAPMNKDVK